MKKKLLIIALLAVAVLAMACGKNKETDGEKKATDLVTLGQYKGIEVEKMVLEVSDDDVTKKIMTNFKTKAEAVEGHNKVELYDLVNIDYAGYLNNVAFDGGTATGQDLLIGSGTYVPGFEEGLIGAEVGKTVEVNVTFPEDYGNTELAGQATVFKITVNSISVLPELTDEFIAANTEYSTYAEYEAYIRDSLETTAESTIEEQFKTDVMNKVIEGCTFDDTLEADTTAYAADLRSFYESYATNYGIDLETFLYYFYGISLSYFESTLPDIAKYNVQVERILNAVAEVEGLEVTDEEYTEHMATLLENTGAESAEELESAYGKDAIISSILSEKAEELIFSTAVAK